MSDADHQKQCYYKLDSNLGNKYADYSHIMLNLGKIQPKNRKIHSKRPSKLSFNRQHFTQERDPLLHLL